MKEKLRRPVLFLGTVAAGSILILVDVPIPVIVAGTLLVGLMMLVGTGALALSDLRPSRWAAAIRDARKKRGSAPHSEPSPAESPMPLISKAAGIRIDTSRLTGLFGMFAKSVRDAILHVRATKDEEKARMKKIDEMLDQTIDDRLTDGSAEPVPASSGGGAGDPLAALADLDAEAFDEIDIDGDVASPPASFDSDHLSLLSEEEASAVSEILKAHQEDLEDFEIPSDLDFPGGDTEDQVDAGSAAGMPAPPARDGAVAIGSDTLDDVTLKELEEIPDAGHLEEELSSLDDLDLDEIEIEDDTDEEEEPDTDTDVAPPPQADVLEEMAEEKPEGGEELDMISFASGGAADDDLIAELKSDVKKKEVVEDLSLLRDLHGQKFDVKELADEMEILLRAMKPKP